MSPYCTPEGGGLERYAHSVASRLAAAGHDVGAAALTMRAVRPSRKAPGAGDASQRGGSTRTTVEDGVTVTRQRAMARLGNTPLHPGFAGTVATAIQDLDADVVVAHTPVPFAAEMAHRAARRLGVPFVAVYHAGRLHGSNPALEAVAALDRATFERSMLRDAAALVAVSPFVRDNALAEHAGKTTVIAPGVDTDLFVPAAPTVRPGQHREILFVAPLSRSYRWKGVDVLLEAYREVLRTVPDARLRLVGTGDRAAELQRRCGWDGLPVQFSGRLGERGLVAAYQNASVLALPSTTDAESFGMVLAEANACGRPVVGSRIGGIPDFVRPGDNGLLAEPGDAASLADALLRILQDPELGDRLGQDGRRRVVAEHHWDLVAQRIETVLAAACGGTTLMSTRTPVSWEPMPTATVPAAPRAGPSSR